MSTTNGHTPLSQLQLASDAVRALLAGNTLEDPWNLERFGEYHGIIEHLILASVVNQTNVHRLWALEAESVPRLALEVNGYDNEGLVTVESLMPLMEQWYHEGVPEGISPGWSSLAKCYRVMPGELTLVIGTPSSGKSHFVSAMMINLAQAENWKFVVFSPEMSPPQRHLELLMTQYVGKPFSRKFQHRMTWQEARFAGAWLHDHVKFVWPRKQRPTVPYLLEMAKREVLLNKIQGLVLDPWNRISHKRHENVLETEYIGDCLSSFAEFCIDNGVCTWIIAHPSKITGGEGGKLPIITPNMIYGSSHWWDMADNILSVWRDLRNADERRVSIHTQKIRWDQSGQMGREVELFYHPDTGRYSELEQRYGPQDYRRAG